MVSTKKPAIVLVMLALALSACAAGESESEIRVVATTTILGDVARAIVGDAASVEVLLPIGADPHDYQASAQQVAAIQRADLVIANGLLLEEGLSDVLEGAKADGANILEVAPLLDPIPFDADDHVDDGMEEHGGLDPHVWLDPIRMQSATRLIAEALEVVEPTGDWTTRADAYAAELAAAHEEIRQILTAVPSGDRRLVTNHASLEYFAQRYDFEIIGTVIPRGSTLADPSSVELAALVDLIRSEDLPAIFVETTEPTALAEAVASEADIEVEIVVLYTGSLGEPGSGADTLIGMLLTDARLIAEALS